MTAANALTETDAVNIMLGVVGQAPVSDLTDPSADVIIAQQILAEQSRSTQTLAWNFNTEEDVDLEASDENSEIVVPESYLRVDVAKTDTLDVVQRGTRLYNKVGSTYEFDADITADEVVVALQFSELPPAARHYVTIRAARVFQRRVLGSESLDGFTAEEEYQALRILREVDGTDSGWNIFDAPDLAVSYLSAGRSY